MPTPGSHKYDKQRTRLRNELDNSGIPDGNADKAANEQMRKENPPAQAPNDRAAGPKGER